jgi:SNF2 family DNA or RNA helicase
MISHLATVLRPHQRALADFALATPRCALWAEMGVGKTLAALAALWELWACGEFVRVLIVGPKRVIEQTWPDELAKWAGVLPGLSMTVIRGTPAQRARLAASPAPIHLIDRDLLPTLVRTRGAAWDYDVLVIDEASGYKSASTQRFKTVRPLLPKFARIIELTGTPQPNSLLDLWAPIYILDGGARLGRSMGAYKDRFFDADYMGWNHTPKPWAKDEIEEKLADLVLPLRAADCVTLPPLTEIDVPVTLPPAARRIYRDVEAGAIADLGDGTNIVANGAAAAVGKLRQITGGYAFTDAGGPATGLHEAKLDALRDLVEASAGAPMLVVYAYVAEREAILAEFPAARTIDAHNAARDFNAGKLPMLVVHPASAGHGLNLQGAASVVVWYGLTWSSEEYLQTNARLHRSGQRNAVRAYRLIARDTVDEDVVDVVMNKKAAQADLVRAILRRRAK